jgi:hypothetical protein
MRATVRRSEWSEGTPHVVREFASGIDIVLAGSRPPGASDHDCFMFPQIDHTLLGTGIVKSFGSTAPALQRLARVVPARPRFLPWASVAYPGKVPLEPMNRLRWSLYPQALTSARSSGARHRAGRSAKSTSRLRDEHLGVRAFVTTQGSVDAIVF